MSNKTIVIGIVNRDTKEGITKKIASAKTYNLQSIIYENIKTAQQL